MSAEILDQKKETINRGLIAKRTGDVMTQASDKPTEMVVD